MLAAFSFLSFYTSAEIEEAHERIFREIPPIVRAEYYESKVSAPIGHEARMQMIRSRSPEFRKALINWGRKMAYPLPGYVDRLWEEELLYYRDPLVIDKYVRGSFDSLEGDDYDYGRYLVLSESPEVVTEAAHYLAFPEFVPNRFVTKQMRAATALLVLIPKCVEFPGEVRLWAQRLWDQGTPDDTLIAIMQRWWEANEAALKGRDYEKIRPGVLSIPGMARSVMSKPPIFEDPGAGLQVDNHSPRPAAFSTPVPSSLRQRASANRNLPMSLFVAGAALSFVLLLVVVSVFRKRFS